jgi:hypothetical protein
VNWYAKVRTIGSAELEIEDANASTQAAVRTEQMVRATDNRKVVECLVYELVNKALVNKSVNNITLVNDRDIVSGVPAKLIVEAGKG